MTGEGNVKISAEVAGTPVSALLSKVTALNGQLHSGTATAPVGPDDLKVVMVLGLGSLVLAVCVVGTAALVLRRRRSA